MSRKECPNKARRDTDKSVRRPLSAEVADDELRRIRALLSLPIQKRVNFLRVRVGKGSAL